MPTVQLFATCLGDLAFPGAVADAETLLRARRLRRRVPESAGLLRSAGVQLRPSGRRAPGRPDVREGVLARRPRSSSPRGRARRWLRTTCPSSSVSSRTRSGSCPPSSSPRGSGPCRETNAGGSPTTTRATCFGSFGSRTSRAGCWAPRARSWCRSTGPISAAASAERSRFVSPRCRWRWPTTSSASADGVGALVTADPGCLMHLRGRAERTGASLRVVHLATALARGVGG